MSRAPRPRSRDGGPAPGARLAALLPRLRHAWGRLVAGHDALFVARWRHGLAREAQRQQDELLTLMLMDALGVESPTAYYTLELYPALVEDFHAWHRRMGEDRLDGSVCC